MITFLLKAKVLRRSEGELIIEANLIELKDSLMAQQVPCAFGTFCIIYNGKVISHHPVSNTRYYSTS